MRRIIVLSILTVLCGCQKFEHSDVKASSCELCTYANTLEGTYRGKISCYWYGNDSATVEIQQIFLGNSLYEDSTYMYFTAQLTFDTLSPGPSLGIDTFRIQNISGELMPSELPTDHWIQRINTDSLIVADQFWGGQSNGYLTENYGILYRQ